MTALSKDWPHKSPILIDPSKKKQLFLLLVLAVCTVVFALKGYDIIDYYVTKHNREVLRPQMAQLAAQGKPQAIAWMVTNDPAFIAGDKFDALKAAAESGDPQSMFLYAQVLKYRNDENGAREYINKAAAEGYPKAVLDQSADALK